MFGSPAFSFFFEFCGVAFNFFFENKPSARPLLQLVSVCVCSVWSVVCVLSVELCVQSVRHDVSVRTISQSREIGKNCGKRY